MSLTPFVLVIVVQIIRRFHALTSSGVLEKHNSGKPLKLRVSQGVLDGSKMRDAQPKYPPLAWRSHIRGDVVLTATLGTDGGDLSNIRIVSGHPVLIQAAMDAVRQWKCKPFLLNGVTVEVDTIITVQFHF